MKNSNWLGRTWVCQSSRVGSKKTRWRDAKLWTSSILSKLIHSKQTRTLFLTLFFIALTDKPIINSAPQTKKFLAKWLLIMRPNSDCRTRQNFIPPNSSRVATFNRTSPASRARVAIQQVAVGLATFSTKDRLCRPMVPASSTTNPARSNSYSR